MKKLITKKKDNFNNNLNNQWNDEYIIYFFIVSNAYVYKFLIKNLNEINFIWWKN